jgi:U3 small nucleolar RNA-associated protein 25
MGGFRKVGRRKKATKKRVEREKEENITRKAEIDAAKVKQAAVEAERREGHQKVLESRGLLGLALRDSLHGVGAVQKARRDAADGEDDARKAKSAYSRLLSLLPQARFNFAVDAGEGAHDTEGDDVAVAAPVAVGGGKRKRAPGPDAAGGSNRKKRREAEDEEADEEDEGSDGEGSDASSGSDSSDGSAHASSDDEAELESSSRVGGVAASVKAGAKAVGQAKAKGGDEGDEAEVISTAAGPDLFEVRYLQNPPPAAAAGPAATSFAPVPFFKLAAAHCGVGWDAASELQLLAAGAAAAGLSSSAEPAGAAPAPSAAPALSYLAALTASDVEKLKVAGPGAAPASSAGAAASTAAPEASLPYDPCTFALGPGYPPVLREGGLAEAHRVRPKLAAAWGETYGHEAHRAAVEAARKVQRAFRRAAERHAAALTVAAGAGAGAGGAKKRGSADSSKAAAAEAEAAAVLAAAAAVRITPAKGRYPFTPLQYALWSPLASYRDVYYAARTASNARELRTVTSLHALNHVVRARDTVAKNNGKSRAAAAAARLARLEKASALGAAGAEGGKGGSGKGKGKAGALPLLLAREAAAAAERGEADDEAAPAPAAAAGTKHGKAAAKAAAAASRPGGLPLLLARELELEAQGSGRGRLGAMPGLDAEEGHLLAMLEDDDDAAAAAPAGGARASASKLGKAAGSATAAPAGGKGKAAAAAAAAATTIDGAAEGGDDCKDSGYTRPRVLVLLPFRHSALQWVRSMLRLLPGRHVQNRNRFFREFSEEGSGLGGEEEDDDADAKAAAKARATGAAAGLPASVLASISRQEQQMMSDLEESDGEAEGAGAGGSSSADAKDGDDAGSGDEEGAGAEGKRGASAAATYIYNRSRQGWTAKTVAQAKAEKRRAAAAAAAGEADDEEDEEEEESEEGDDDAEDAADAPLSALAATAGRSKTDDRIIKEGAVKFDGRGRRIRPRRKRKVRKGKGGMVGAATAAPAQQPLDYRQAFAGNIDDDFKVGISINGRKSVKLFADFYSADILVASPLGLRRLVGGEGDKKRETDFLSSIEVLVLDAAEVLLQQNWGHVRDIMALLNATPRSTAHVDFSRVRELHLEGRAAEVRQTLCFSGYMAPDITALMRRQCKNSGLMAPAGAASAPASGASKKKGAAAAATSTALVAASAAPSLDVGGGSLLFRCRYEGTISRVVPTVRQVFQRIAADSVAAADDARFAYFRDTLLPELQAGVSSDTGSVLSHTLIFCPSYFEYVRLRNLLDARELEFVTACEYSEDADVTRARTRFYAGHSPLLLTTERFHFFRRLRLRGARHLLFYGPPAACVFYPELVNGLEEASARGHPISVTVLYTQADAAALERVVGSDRAGRMLAPGAKSSHHFV